MVMAMDMTGSSTLRSGGATSSASIQNSPIASAAPASSENPWRIMAHSD